MPSLPLPTALAPTDVDGLVLRLMPGGGTRGRPPGINRSRNAKQLMGLVFGSYIDKMPGDSCRGGHRGADQVCAPTATLAPLEVAVAGGGAALAFRERIAVHGDAHAASRLTPLKASLAEDVGQAFFFGHTAHIC